MNSDLFDHIPDFLGEIKFLGATRLVDATSNLFRKSKNGQVLERLLSLEALISNLSAFQASRPHDIIYAVLNLAKGMRTSAATSSKDTLVELSILYRTSRLIFQYQIYFSRTVPSVQLQGVLYFGPSSSSRNRVPIFLSAPSAL